MPARVHRRLDRQIRLPVTPPMTPLGKSNARRSEICSVSVISRNQKGCRSKKSQPRPYIWDATSLMRQLPSQRRIPLQPRSLATCEPTQKAPVSTVPIREFQRQRTKCRVANEWLTSLRQTDHRCQQRHIQILGLSAHHIGTVEPVVVRAPSLRARHIQCNRR